MMDGFDDLYNMFKLANGPSLSDLGIYFNGKKLGVIFNRGGQIYEFVINIDKIKNANNIYLAKLGLINGQ